ncbi:unnamed protein product [Urochloa decumbens]|uniref:Uncharacterized protein n=1 Tax=Urochloa decumbens TaxID=240449 RepID=A0ABC8VA72_9POAL
MVSSTPDDTGSFWLLAAFSRSRLRLDSSSVSNILQSVLGGTASLFAVVEVEDRIYKFSVSSKAVVLAIYSLWSFSYDQFRVFFHLWNTRGLSLAANSTIKDQGPQYQWQEVRSKKDNRTFANVAKGKQSSQTMRPQLTGANRIPVNYSKFATHRPQVKRSVFQRIYLPHRSVFSRLDFITIPDERLSSFRQTSRQLKNTKGSNLAPVYKDFADSRRGVEPWPVLSTGAASGMAKPTWFSVKEPLTVDPSSSGPPRFNSFLEFKQFILDKGKSPAIPSPAVQSTSPKETPTPPPNQEIPQTLRPSPASQPPATMAFQRVDPTPFTPRGMQWMPVQHRDTVARAVVVKQPKRNEDIAIVTFDPLPEDADEDEVNQEDNNLGNLLADLNNQVVVEIDILVNQQNFLVDEVPEDMLLDGPPQEEEQQLPDEAQDEQIPVLGANDNIHLGLVEIIPATGADPAWEAYSMRQLSNARPNATGTRLWAKHFAAPTQGCHQADIPPPWADFFTLLLLSPCHYRAKGKATLIELSPCHSPQLEAIASAPSSPEAQKEKKKRKSSRPEVLLETEVRRSPRVRKLKNGYKHTSCANKACLGCDTIPPSISPSVIKNLGTVFCKIEENKLTTEALRAKRKVGTIKKKSKSKTHSEDEEDHAVEEIARVIKKTAPVKKLAKSTKLTDVPNDKTSKDNKKKPKKK